MPRLPRLVVTSLTLLFVLGVTETPLLAQLPGHTPETAITITAADSGRFYDSRRGEFGVESDLTEECNASGNYSPPYYDDFWFKYSAARNEKLIYFEALTLEGTDDDFLAILFVYEQTESGLSPIGCHGDGAAWILSLRPGRTYLFRVVALSSIWWGGDWSAYLGHGGKMQILIESSPIGVLKDNGTTEWGWIFWGDMSHGTIGVLATSPDFFCGSLPTDPIARRWTSLRSGARHDLYQGDVYTVVYRPHDFDEAIALIETDYCQFLARTDWLVADGIAKLSWHDNNGPYLGDKAATWGATVRGRLTDVTGECRSGMTNVQWHFTVNAPKPNHPDRGDVALSGPNLSCDPKN